MPELSSEPATLPQQPGTSYACVSESADTEYHAEDPLNEGVHDEHNVMENYASEWVESLSKDDLLSLSIVLWHLLVGILSFKLTSAAELIGRVVGRSDRTIREWRATFNANKGTWCWAQAKRYVRAHTNYTLGGLRQNVPQGLDYVTVENIRNHFRKVRHYMFGYLLGVSAGPELEEHVKKCKKIYTSHRRVGVNE